MSHLFIYGIYACKYFYRLTGAQGEKSTEYMDKRINILPQQTFSMKITNEASIL